MSAPRILIAGIGNIFLGDDGFGSEVAQRLTQRQWPANVRVVDYGIRGFDLAFALMDDCEAAIVVDATPQGGAPGTLYVLDPDLSNLDAPDPDQPPLETHGMQPLQVFRLVQKLGGQLPKLLIVGCEPGDFGPPDEGRIGLSPPVAAAVEPACARVESLAQEMLRQAGTMLVNS